MAPRNHNVPAVRERQSSVHAGARVSRACRGQHAYTSRAASTTRPRAHASAHRPHTHTCLAARQGPLGAIDYWRKRSVSFAGVYEQLQSPPVLAVMQALARMDSQKNLPDAEVQASEVSKLYAEAKDNVKFLSTLERHFKTIHRGDFQTILDTLPTMLNAIRMV